MALIPNIIIDKLQERIANEEANSKAYEAMKNWLKLKGFEGAAKLWGDYAKEELDHKNWSVDFLLDLNILPLEQAQEQPQTEFKGLPNIVALSYQRELETTQEVKDLAKACLDEGDMLTFGLAQRYITEQVQELSKIQLWIDQMNDFGTDPVALRLLDERMGK